MNSLTPTVSTYTYAYRSVFAIPQYINFQYEINWISVVVFGTLIYGIPSTIVFARIIYFYFKHTKLVRKSSLSVEMLQSFLLMQFWNILAIIGDYLMFRLPSTTILTGYYSSQDPQLLMRFSVFMYYWGTVTSQALTVLFCVMRVSIMFYNQRRHKNPIIIVSVIIMLIGFLTALPHLFTEGYGIQLYEPYPFGSLILLSQFYKDYSKAFVSLLGLFTTLTTILIIVLNGMMLIKMKKQNKLNSTIRVSNKSKAEKTLTGTMIILLVPLVISQLSSLLQLFRSEYLSYVLFLRPFFVDMRVHVVTVYFWMTHPIFKKQQTVILTVSSQTNMK